MDNGEALTLRRNAFVKGDGVELLARLTSGYVVPLLVRSV